MAGETVECPNCEQQMVVPQPPREEVALDDISFGGDETPPVTVSDIIASVSEAEPDAAQSPVCPECGADMDPDAVLCLHCGYHKALGKKIATELE